jgi:hypothetical protein
VDPLSLAIGAVLLVAGFLAGRIRRPNARPKPVTATCECGHSIGTHAKDGGRCNADVRRPGDMDHAAKWVPCACLHYVGPEPISSLFALPIADEEG